ncbi:type II secretion system protein [Niabella drilacis]|nr:hypothetical protein [Niabella drilacis]
MHCLKKIYKRKIPAFTLPELVVGLLLMAILFGVIATVYMILARQSAHYFTTHRFFTGYYLTKKQLQQDFEKARSIRLDAEHHQLILREEKGVALKTITYRLDTAFIVRSDGDRSDTLYPGARIAAQRYLNDSTPLLVSIKLQHRYGTQYFHTSLGKHYAQADLLNDSTTTEP